jgi:Fe-S cluster assembly iron-binding protein IscA
MHLIHLSAAAILAIKKYQLSLQIPDTHFLRIGIKQKNANDKGLIIGFDEPKDNDKTTEIEGIKIVYHPGQALFFAGMTVDYKERDEKKGFELIEKIKQ